MLQCQMIFVKNGTLSTLKNKLTEVLGYEISEPEHGYEFKYFD